MGGFRGGGRNRHTTGEELSYCLPVLPCKPSNRGARALPGKGIRGGSNRHTPGERSIHCLCCSANPATGAPERSPGRASGAASLATRPVNTTSTTRAANQSKQKSATEVLNPA